MVKGISFASVTALVAVILLTASLAAAAVDLSRRVQFDIPAQPLSTALLRFSEQASVQLAAPSALLTGLETAGVHGEHAMHDALGVLLLGTGLTFQALDEHTVAIRKNGESRSTSPGTDGGGASEKAAAGGRDDSNGRFRLTQSNVPQAPLEGAEDRTAQNANDNRVDLGKVVVTGSRLIAPKQGAQDVRIYGRERIEASGATSVGTFLNSLPEVSIQNTDSPYQTFAGASTVQLRGLPAGTTLTLINGRRVETSASQSAFGFFDLNNVPVSLVERIEVLPAGSSAVYGGDALAGVVNIVLKEHVDGFETNVGYLATTESGFDEVSASIGWGASWERASISTFGNYRQQDELIGAERSITANQDYTRFGSLDFRSLACDPGSVQTLDGSDLPGLSEPIAAAPASASGIVTPQDFTAGVMNRCSDDAARGSILPEVDQSSAVVMGTLELGSSAELFVELMASRIEKERSRSGLRVSFSEDDFVLAAANPFNPFGIDVGIEFRTPRADVERSETEFSRWLLGARGAFSGSWSWEIAGWSTREKTEIHDRSGADAAIEARLSSTDPAVALNPFATSGPPSALYEAIYPLREQRFRTRGDALNAFVRGTLPLLPAGPLQLVIGGEARREELLEFTNGPETEVRDVSAIFAEARVPLLSGEARAAGAELLALSLAGRFDHYSDNFGDATNPQVGVELRPTDAWLFRGSYSETFKPPGLFALFAPVFEFDFPIIDPTQPPGQQNYAVTLAFGGNPDLEPETGRFESFGVVYTLTAPTPATFALTYWDATLDNRIGLPFPPQPLIDNEAAFPDRVIRGPDGRITNVDATRLNFGHMETSGVDLQLDAAINAGAWILKPAVAVTRTLEYESAIQFGVPPEDNLGRATQIGGFSPRWKGTAVLGFERRPWFFQLSGRYVGSYVDYDLRGFITDPPTNGDVWYVDASFRWNIPGVFGSSSSYLQLTGINVFDRQPQFSHYDTFGYDPSQYDIRGRYVSLAIGARW